MKVGDTVYRVEGVITAPMLDEYGYSTGGSGYSLRQSEFEVTRLTPKGFVIDDYRGERFICNSWKKKYANPTSIGAYEDFLLRKRRQKRIIKRQLFDVEQFEKLVLKVLGDNNESEYSD